MRRSSSVAQLKAITHDHIDRSSQR